MAQHDTKSTAPQALAPFKLRAWLKPVIWGGERIAAFKGMPPQGDVIGESWEVSALEGMESVVAEGPDAGLTLSQMIVRYGEQLVGTKLKDIDPHDFPLLIKFIDARRNLSLQVHPDDAMAQRCHGCSGKTEMWYIIDADPGAVIYAGFAHDLDPDEYEERVTTGAILDDVMAHQSAPGEVYFLPAGRIHAIGEGNFLIEIQRSSDITYRVYDYNRIDANGRRRPLHVEAAREALDFQASPLDDIVSLPRRIDEGLAELIECPWFGVKRVTVEGVFNADLSAIDSPVSITCIGGRLSVRADGKKPLRLHQGETAMIPASAHNVRFAGNAILVTARV